MTRASVDVDVVVVGLGVLGAATLAELARDGVRAVGLDRFAPGHANGSSHGRSRAVRFLYHAPEYVALLRPAIERWRGLERDGRRRLYWPCGTLFFGQPGNALLAQNVRVATDAGLPVERLDEAAARRRFPAFAMTPGSEGVFLTDGGMVDADACVATFIEMARRHDATIRPHERVIGLDLSGSTPAVRLEGGDLRARHLVVAAGAWTRGLLPDLAPSIRVTRQAFFTMRPHDPSAVGPDRVPVWCDYETMYYGFPDHGPGLKIADDTPGPEADPDGLDRHDPGDEELRLIGFLRNRFPTTRLDLIETGTCLYTLTPDEDFLLGPVPGSDGSVSVVVGLNHAFKFAPVIGRILADLATAGRTDYPIDRFRVDRFAPTRATAESGRSH